MPPGESGLLEGCIYTEAEARELAELIFLGIGFDKGDIMLTPLRLLVIPFVGESR